MQFLIGILNIRIHADYNMRSKLIFRKLNRCYVKLFYIQTTAIQQQLYLVLESDTVCVEALLLK